MTTTEMDKAAPDRDLAGFVVTLVIIALSLVTVTASVFHPAGGAKATGGVIVREQNLPVYEGWQCVSLPAHLESRQVSAIFRGAPAGIKVWQWDEAANGWSAMNTFNGSEWTRPDEWIPAGHGVMVWSPSRADLPQRGLFILEYQTPVPDQP